MQPRGALSYAPPLEGIGRRIDGYLESVTLDDILKGEVGEKSAGKENF